MGRGNPGFNPPVSMGFRLKRTRLRQVEGQAMILGDEGWPVATAKGMQARVKPIRGACREAKL